MEWRPEALLDSIIWVCLDIWVFSVLDNRLWVDNLSQLSKVSIWLRKGWEEVFWSPFLLRFDSDKWDLTQNVYALLSQSWICCKYALFWSRFLLRFDSDKWDSTQTWLRHLSKKWQVKSLMEPKNQAIWTTHCKVMAKYISIYFDRFHQNLF